VEGHKVKPEAIGIIGGSGRMGRWFHRLFEQEGYNVLISDLKGGLSKVEIALKCNVIVLSLPINAIEEVIKEVGPLMDRDSLLMDITSLKEEPVRWMMMYTEGDVIGTHPLFGPDTPSPKDQILFICPGRVKLWDEWFRSFFSKKGMNLIEIEPSEHDNLMAIIQSLRHAIMVSLGTSLMRSNFDLRTKLDISGKWFQILIDILKRQTRQPPDLYVEMILKNHFVPEVFRVWKEAVQEIVDCIESKDRNSLLKLMKDLALYLEKY
jgi:prephenate dehydrogenase